MENDQQPAPEHPGKHPKQKRSLKDFLSLGEVGGYFFRKKDPTRPLNANIRIMHGINKISIIVFLLGVIYLVVKRFFL